MSCSRETGTQLTEMQILPDLEHWNSGTQPTANFLAVEILTPTTHRESAENIIIIFYLFSFSCRQRLPVAQPCVCIKDLLLEDFRKTF